MTSKTNTIFSLIRFTPNSGDYLDRKLGSRGELFFDSEADTLRLYNGQATGGISLARNDLSGINTNALKQAIVDTTVATVVYTVTITGPQSPDTGNKYNLNGIYRPTLNFVTGYTYVFDQSNDTNVYYPNANGTTQNRHPLNFSADNPSGVRGGGTAYTTDVIYKLDGVAVTYAVYNSSAFDTANTRTVQITVTNDTPATLYYWCFNHLAMGEEIAVADPGSGAGGATVSVGDTLPEDPISGNLWLNTNNGFLYVYIDDGTSTQWIQPSYPQPSIGNFSFDVTTLDTTDSSGITVVPAVTFNSDVTVENDLRIRTNLVATQDYVDQAVAGVVVGALNITPATIGLGNVTNESKATMFTAPTFTGNITLSGTTIIQQTVEVLNTKTGATGTVDHDFSTGSVWYHSSAVADFTANFTNIPTTSNRAISVVLVLNQGSSGYYATAVQIDGASQTIKWLAGVSPTVSVNKIDILSFTLIRTGSSWAVLGSMSSYG
jgi:hypothetical protein